MASSVSERVRDPGYTPGIKDLPALLDLFASDDDDVARAAERAVLRIETRHTARALGETLARAKDAKRPARGRLTKLVGRLAANARAESSEAEASHAARRWLVEALADADLKTRHTAARALGNLKHAPAEHAEVERALLVAWDAARGDDDRKSVAEALGKIGSKAARERLAGTRAALIIDRTTARESPGAIDLTRRHEGPVAVRFHARAGLEGIVAEELGDRFRPRIAGPGIVEARLDGPLAAAAGVRTALRFGFPLDPVPTKNGDVAAAVVEAILQRRSLGILRTFTRTNGAPIRFRLAWERGGHRRALTWQCAELVARATKELVNDPTESTWEIAVDDLEDRVVIELVPRGFTDERFAYRTHTVPASSHPTIAAALARLAHAARASDGETVWDPFVGAAAELVERAKLGGTGPLIGTDTEASAVEAARANLAAAGVEAQILRVDGTTYEPRGVGTILTNPPMGRRVHRGSHVELLGRFVEHAARVLVPNGVLVWASPEPRRLGEAAAKAGLVVERSITVDMGGFPAELTVHRKRLQRSRR
ncbi:MAG: methyltransferase [Deltaproteobacteria bacterium]|nr:methyltransferase [Deltaproteobacteria bacterium]